MRVVTVSRMPLPSSVAENCLKWGTGGLCIDGCRVPLSGEQPKGSGSRKVSVSGDIRTGASLGMYGPGGNGGNETPLSGRWPTNTILIGVRALEGFPESSITGERSSQSKAARVEGTLWGTDNYESTEYTDSGSSARFFKQIGGPGQQMNKELPQELITYLLTLIGSPDGAALYLGSLTDFNWGDLATWEDNSQYGLLAEGCPTEEQVAELQRVLRPGAHLLLVAPEEQPTGHTGTCRLEDGGFEIRDAILLIDEPGRFHYVPKTSRAEREAGCGLLPGKPRKETVCSQCESKKEDPDTLVECPESDSGEHDWVEVETEAGVRNNHPTIKPTKLMKRLLSDVPLEGGPVLDPFMGSGTTLLACLDTGHDALGIDQDGDYVQIADARVRHHDRAIQRKHETTIESDCPTNAEPEEMSLEEMLGLVPPARVSTQKTLTEDWVKVYETTGEEEVSE